MDRFLAHGKGRHEDTRCMAIIMSPKNVNKSQGQVCLCGGQQTWWWHDQTTKPYFSCSSKWTETNSHHRPPASIDSNAFCSWVSALLSKQDVTDWHKNHLITLQLICDSTLPLATCWHGMALCGMKRNMFTAYTECHVFQFTVINRTCLK